MTALAKWISLKWIAITTATIISSIKFVFPQFTSTFKNSFVYLNKEWLFWANQSRVFCTEDCKSDLVGNHVLQRTYWKESVGFKAKGNELQLPLRRSYHLWNLYFRTSHQHPMNSFVCLNKEWLFWANPQSRVFCSDDCKSDCVGTRYCVSCRWQGPIEILHNLLQNADFNANVSIKVWRKC